MNTVAIIDGCLKKNKVAQKALVTKFSGLLYTLCRRYCYREMDARDVLQESLILIFKNMQSFDLDKGSLEAWMKKITINAALQHNRKTKIVPLNLMEEKDSLDTVEPLAIQNLSEEEIIGLIAELPDQYRTVFNLYVVDGYSHQEIGDKLDISAGTSRSNLSRAKSILKNKILSIENNLPCQTNSLKRK